MKFNKKNIQISPTAKIGLNVQVGDNTIIYDNVVIGDNTIIANNCVIGEPLNAYYNSQHNYSNPETIIGENSLIRSHTIIYAGCSIGDYFQTGHRVAIREYSVFGNNCSVGTNSDIQGYCTIGKYCRFHSFVNIGQKSEIGDYVFIYPFVVLTNDPTPPSEDLIGVKIGDYTQLAAGCILLPGSSIGQHSLVSANSTVGGSFDNDSFISGNPAKKIGTLSKMPFFNQKGKRHYPWPYNFNRGMPWAEIGYDEWIKQFVND